MAFRTLFSAHCFAVCLHEGHDVLSIYNFPLAPMCDRRKLGRRDIVCSISAFLPKLQIMNSIFVEFNNFKAAIPLYEMSTELEVTICGRLRYK